MGRFLGGRFGSNVPIEPAGQPAAPGVYSSRGQWWMRKINNWSPTVMSASGGTKYTPGNGYVYHVFTGAGNMVVTTASPTTNTLDVLIQGGGGSAAPGYSGGGGAGGMIRMTAFPVGPSQTNAVAIGSGGSSSRAPGGDTTFTVSPTNATYPGLVITAKGGGGGGGYSTITGKPGGCGGGAQDIGIAKGTTVQPTQNTPISPQPWFTQYGTAGGAGTQNGAYHSAGGGGCGEAGGTAGPGPGTTSGWAGFGGRGSAQPGFEYPLIGQTPIAPSNFGNSPTNNHYGGGGCGWGYNANPLRSARAYGGGGWYGPTVPTGGPKDGTDFLGGGSAANSVISGDGACIVRYPSAG